MSQWYYARGGQRLGPVDRQALESLARSGGLSADDLVWTEGMSDWQPARQVEGLLPAPEQASPAPAPAGDPANPYASPASMVEPAPAGVTPADGAGGLPILDPPAGLTVGGPIQLAFEILKKDFGMIFVAGLVYYAVIFGISMIFQIIGSVVQVATGMAGGSAGGDELDMLLTQGVPMLIFSVVSQLVQQLAGVFLALGLTRIAMEVIEGKPVRIGAMFGEGRRLLGAFLGSILLALMVIGLPLLVIIPGVIVGAMNGNENVMIACLVIGGLLILFPGMYFAIRFGFYQIAMVDRDMGVIDAFGESSRLTRGNKWAIFALYVVLGLINLAGMLVLCVGLIFTIPLTMLTMYVTYKWIAHGPDALWEIHRPKLPGM